MRFLGSERDDRTRDGGSGFTLEAFSQWSGVVPDRNPVTIRIKTESAEARGQQEALSEVITRIGPDDELIPIARRLAIVTHSIWLNKERRFGVAEE